MTLLVCDHSLNWEEGHFNSFQRLDINKLWRGVIGVNRGHFVEIEKDLSHFHSEGVSYSDQYLLAVQTGLHAALTIGVGIPPSPVLFCNI